MAKRPRFAATLAVAALSLVVVGLTFGTASSQVQTTLSLNFPESDPDAVIDGGKRGSSIGDVLFFKGALTDDDGAKVGAIIAQISTYSRSGGKSQIEGTITLTDQGTLVFSGQLNVSGETEDQGTIAVVGGTGDFEGARGVATSTIEFDTGNVHLQITLI